MARPVRLQTEGCFYHITSRGDDRKQIFKSERDYLKFLEYTSIAKDKFAFYLHAYCLMPNHYHLFIETTQANLSRIMQYLNTAYTVYYNVKRKRCGHLFQGRFKSIIVEEDSYYAELTRYIHLNPVRAKMVKSPQQYRWSSFNAFIDARCDVNVDMQRVLLYLSMDPRHYEDFVCSSSNDCPNPLDDIYAGCILGRTDFVRKKIQELGNIEETKDFSHKRAIKNIIDPHIIVHAAASLFSENPETMRTMPRKNTIAKKTAIYLLRRKTGLTNRQIGELFAMKSAAISMAAKKFEHELYQNKGLKKRIDALI